ncbi:MAG TPA: efflux RND transporter periplasmic adaptor subunit [Candidatus Acidoferrum sp.]|nr:efflux RND transporter periplasmic adaptor subunit [Candidatus Acidoferrum sp.]
MRKVSMDKQGAWKSGTLLMAAWMFFAGAGCGKEEKEKEPVVSVQATPAQRATIAQRITAEVVIFPLEQATVAPKITSTVKKFLVQRGTRVKKGQLLAELENADLSASAEASKGDYEQAEANYVITVGSGLPQQIQKAELDATSAKAAFDAQQRIYDSRKELLQQGAIPRREVEAAEVALAQARSQNEQAQKQLADLQRLGKEQQLKSAQGSKESAEGKYRGATAQLSYSLIKSPIDGVITDRPLYEGDLATANQPILTVMNLSRLIGKAHIPQAEAAQLKVGNAAELMVPGLDEPVKGAVTLVSPALDPGSTTIEVWVEARKPNPALKPGMTVAISMVSKMAKDAIVVPAEAVFKTEEGASYVLLAGSDEKAHQKTVQVGIRSANQAQVLSGINEGDPVITTGGYAIPDGTQIKVEKPGAESADKSDKDGDKKDAKGDPKDSQQDKNKSSAERPATKGKE